jgi:spoIIIJ-associated protein
VESLEVSAKTVNEAIDQALAILGKTRDEIDVSVLSEGSRGILGIGGEEARILVSVRAPEAPPVEQATDETAEMAAVGTAVLEKILAGLRIRAKINVRTPSTPASDGSHIVLDIEGDELGMLIGRRGETLSSIQFLVNLIAGKEIHRWTRMTVDVSGYRERREELLKGLALRMAERVQATRQPVALEAMPANERRIVHLALADHPFATTQSIGEGDDRKVVIIMRR